MLRNRIYKSYLVKSCLKHRFRLKHKRKAMKRLASNWMGYYSGKASAVKNLRLVCQTKQHFESSKLLGLIFGYVNHLNFLGKCFFLIYAIFG